MPSTTIDDFCLRPDAGDVLFSLRAPEVEQVSEPGAPHLNVYRSTVSPDGALGPVTVFVDLSDRYDVGDAFIERVQCHSDTARVLLTVANQARMNGADQWWAELWLLDTAGEPVADHALARDIGPANAAWSPDGLRLLLEASPQHEAGRVYVYELATEKAEPLEGVTVQIVAGPGGGWLHWGADGQLAILESTLIPGVETRAMDVVDVSGPRPAASSHRDLPDAIATTPDAQGGLIVLTAGSVSGVTPPPPLRVFRWDPALPAAGPTPLGEMALGADPLTFHIADPAVLPSVSGRQNDTATTRVVFIASLAGDRALLLGEMSSGQPTAAWRLAPAGLAVQKLRVAGGWLGYRARHTKRNSTEFTEAPFDVAAQLRIIPPAELERELMDANPDFERIEQP